MFEDGSEREVRNGKRSTAATKEGSKGIIECRRETIWEKNVREKEVCQ